MENIFDYITNQKVKYSKSIPLEDGWDWSMKDHIRKSFLYKNSQFLEENENRYLRPYKNIILGILNVQYRTEGFDVKDIELYVNDVKDSYKSFLVKKYHDKWSLDKSIDTFIDSVVENYVDYGGALIKKIDEARPIVIDLRSLAFCNQTNILDNPFGILHTLSFSQLRKQKKWGLPEYGATIDIETLINLVKKEEDTKEEVEIYEVHGSLPVEWLKDTYEEVEESEKDVLQMQIVAFYKDENNQEQGVVLFKHKEPTLPFKLLKRDDIVDRALGRGGIEELFETQTWTNWNEIKATELMEAASKMIPITNDETLSAKHPTGMKGMDNMEFLTIQSNKEVKILDNYPRNLNVFNDSLTRWEEHAQTLGAAQDPLQGETPPSGTPFKLYEAQTLEGKGIHKYRQGKIAVFIEEVYRDWILPHIQKELANDQEFLGELSFDEMVEISDKVSTNIVNRKLVNKILNGEIISKEDAQVMKSEEQNKFLKAGNKKFIKILKDEIKKPLSVIANIAGKQKNLALLTDKVVNLVRQFLTTPQIRQDPEMAKILNTILESSGLSPIMFSPSPSLPLPVQGKPTTEPLENISQAQTEEQQKVFA